MCQLLVGLISDVRAFNQDVWASGLKAPHIHLEGYMGVSVQLHTSQYLVYSRLGRPHSQCGRLVPRITKFSFPGCPALSSLTD